jgi:P pilus assembly chaperone PapD
MRLASAQAAPAPQGTTLLVAPSRLVFEGHQRTAQVNLTHGGSQTTTYRITLVPMDMDQEGRITEHPPEPSSDREDLRTLFRFSPRQVTLEPQETQTIRIQVRKPGDLPPGEYRLHMLFREEAPAEAQPPAPGFHLRPLYGVAIPLILRHGEPTAQVSMTALTLAGDRRALSLRLERTGNASIHGDLKATFQPRSGQAQVLGRINALSVYTPNPFRKVTLPLAPLPPGPGRLRITLTTPETQGAIRLAEGLLELP